jgi:hypothetical protein
MSKLTIAFVLAAGLGVGAFVQAADACTYSCPKGKYVCPSSLNKKTGCYRYTCASGRIGGPSCAGGN